MYFAFMRHDDANCDRSYRWIEGRCGLLATRVTSYAAFGQAMSFGLLPKGAFSTV
jgi:hypothetical protein